MNLKEFQQLVTNHADWFRGTRRESLDSLRSAESQLRVALPESMKWLLAEFGYWRATGISSLTYCVYSTLWKRTELPDHYVILAQPTAAHFDHFNERTPCNDAETKLGFIVLKTDERTGDGNECAVYWARGPRRISLPTDSQSCCSPSCVQFNSFAQFVAAHLQFMKRNSRDEFVVNPIGWSEPQSEPIPLNGDVRQTEAVLQFLAETIASPITNVNDVADGSTIVETVQQLQALRRYQSMTDGASRNVPAMGKSSSTWHVAKPAEHLFKGQLLASPLSSDCRPIPSELPPKETWVAVVDDGVQTGTLPRHPHLISWIPPAYHHAIESSDVLQGGSFWISDRVKFARPLVEAGLQLR